MLTYEIGDGRSIIARPPEYPPGATGMRYTLVDADGTRRTLEPLDAIALLLGALLRPAAPVYRMDDGPGLDVGHMGSSHDPRP